MRRLFFVMLIAMMLSLPQVVFCDDEISYSGSSTIGMSILDAGAVKAFEQDRDKIQISRAAGVRQWD